MDDDFEFYITFPVIAEPVVSKEPVIILFGWAGCVDRYLAKYSEIYQKKGCTTIRYITSPNVVSPRCIDEKKIHNLAGNVINLLLDMKFDKHPIFFHVFSNGGATVYRYVSELMRKKHPNDFQYWKLFRGAQLEELLWMFRMCLDDSFHIKGCIFDSCPAKVRASGFVRATLAMTDGSLVKRYMIAFVALVRAMILGVYSALLSFFTGKINYYLLWNALLEEPNICPQLFLFSKTDNVCCWDTIQEFADYRKKKGVDVKVVLFEESEHVKHLVKYRDEYLNHVYSFIDENVGSDSPCN